MADLFLDPVERLADIAPAIPNFAVGVRAVESTIDAKSRKQAELAARTTKSGGRITTAELIAALPPAYWEEWTRAQAAEKIQADAQAAKAQLGSKT